MKSLAVGSTMSTPDRQYEHALPSRTAFLPTPERDHPSGEKAHERRLDSRRVEPHRAGDASTVTMSQAVWHIRDASLVIDERLTRASLGGRS